MDRDKRAAQGLALLRGAIGVWLLWQALPNLDHSFIDSLPKVVSDAAQYNPIGPYRWFLQTVVESQTAILAQILSIGPALVGAALLIGFLTRFVCGLGLFYSLNLLLATGHINFYHQTNGILLSILFATFFLADAGHYYGLDAFLFKDADEHDDAPIPIKNKKQKAAIETLQKHLTASKKSGKKSKVKTFD